MGATQLVSFIMSSFSVSHLRPPQSADASNSKPFTLSWESLLSPVEEPHPQMYSVSGYNAAYYMCMCLQGLALVIFLFINSERGRKAQEKEKAKAE